MNYFKKLNSFYKSFKGEKGVIGKSFLKKDILCFAVKKTAFPVVIVQYCIHAREYVTTYLFYKQIKEFLKKGKRGTVYFLPCTNPDGVEIALKDKPLYKANARGVDLNVNFDADWSKGEKNVFTAGDENFVGERPFSEPETRALADFTLKVKPNGTISYHSKGEEIYWRFHQTGSALSKDLDLAKKISLKTKYQLKETPFSCGGYKDWCISKLKIPALTIEVGKDCYRHPLPPCKAR